jgi:hypothetical protein
MYVANILIYIALWLVLTKMDQYVHQENQEKKLILA